MQCENHFSLNVVEGKMMWWKSCIIEDNSRSEKATVVRKCTRLFNGKCPGSTRGSCIAK